MRINYVAHDRPDFSYAAGSLARGAMSPTTKRSEELKTVGRYLRGRPVGTLVLTLPGALEVFCDADHAGDHETRWSRSGMAVFRGRHLLKHGSSVQSTVALSSGDSEYSSHVAACIGHQSHVAGLALLH